MELRAAVAILRRWWWLWVAAALLAGTLAYGVGRGRLAVYEARATLLVQQVPAAGGPTYSEVLASQQLARTYSQLVTANPVLEQAAATLRLSVRDVAAMVRAQGRRDTQLIDVIARAPEPGLATRIANEVAQTFAQRVQEAYAGLQTAREADLAQQIAAVQRGIDDKQQHVARLSVRSPALPEDQRLEQLAQARADLDALRQNLTALQQRQQDLRLDQARGGGVTVITPARVPDAPTGPPLAFRTLLGAATGLALALVTIGVAEHLDDTVKTGAAVARCTRLPLLGAVPCLPRGRRRAPPGSGPAVASTPFRALLAALTLPPAGRGAAGTLLVTSTDEREGRTTVATGLAQAAALTGQHVLLVDADLDRPALHRWFGLPNRAGLTTLLARSDLTVDGLAQAVGERLRVLTAGPPIEPASWPPERLATVLRELAHAADLVLVDGPPLSDGADAAVLAARADGVLLVAAVGRTRVPALASAADLLAFVGAHAHGVVLTHGRGWADRRPLPAPGPLSAAGNPPHVV